LGIFKTPAVVINRGDYSETSQIVVLYTRKYGKIESIAKGIRRPRASFEGALDLLDCVEIVFSQKSVLHLAVLRESTTLESFPSLRSDFDRYAVASCMIEIMREITRGHDPHVALYDTFLDCLRSAAAWPDPTKALWTLAVKALTLSGFLPSSACCVVCSGEVPRARDIAFSVARSGVLCSACVPEGGDVIRISGETVAVLTALATQTVEAIGTIRFSRTCSAELRQVVSGVLASVFSKMLKSLEFLPAR